MVEAAELRAQQLLEANNRYVENNRLLRAALKKATDKFSFYAEQHWAKTEDYSYTAKQQYDATQKARVNEALVSEFKDILDQTKPS